MSEGDWLTLGVCAVEGWKEELGPKVDTEYVTSTLL